MAKHTSARQVSGHTGHQGLNTQNFPLCPQPTEGMSDGGQFSSQIHPYKIHEAVLTHLSISYYCENTLMRSQKTNLSSISSAP